MNIGNIRTVNQAEQQLRRICTEQPWNITFARPVAGNRKEQCWMSSKHCLAPFTCSCETSLPSAAVKPLSHMNSCWKSAKMTAVFSTGSPYSPGLAGISTTRPVPAGYHMHSSCGSSSTTKSTRTVLYCDCWSRGNLSKLSVCSTTYTQQYLLLGYLVSSLI